MSEFPVNMILDRISDTPGSDPESLNWKDFVSDQEIRWCPGCGDYSILRQIQMVMPQLGVPREKVVFISGIGCASRFPYYMDTYGFHGIHGRALTLATGLKTSRPDLSVWVITGDGDGLAIGGNHFIHTMRRNPDINFILFNNRVYGLTKGQYSPTSEMNMKTKSSPFGTVESPLNPISLAVAAGASFAARAYDVDMKHLQEVIRRTALHRGTSFVEIYQNCVVYNDKTFDEYAVKSERPHHTLYLEHGKPLLYGSSKNKGVILQGLNPTAVDLADNGHAEPELIVHDEKSNDGTLAYILSKMDYPDFPVPVGVFRDVEQPVYNELVQEQINREIEKNGIGNVQDLLESGDVWRVK